MHTSNTLNTIKSYSNTFNMPYITTAMAVNNSKQEHGFQLFVRPLYVRALLDLIKYYQWREAFYFYSTNEGLERIQQLFDIITEKNYPLKIKVYRVENASGVLDALAKINNLDYKRILLDLPAQETESVINKTFEVKLVLLNLNEMISKAFTLGGLNVTGLCLVDSGKKKSLVRNWYSFYFDEVITQDLPMPGEAALIADAAFLMAHALAKVFKHKTPLNDHSPNSNGVFGESLSCETEPTTAWKYGEEVMKALKEQTNLTGLFTGPLIFDRFGLRKHFTLEVLESRLNGPLMKFGTWDSKHGLTVIQNAHVRTKGNNTIANKTRIVTSVFSAPFLMLKNEPGLEGNSKYEGYCADLTKMIAEMIKFDYKIIPVKDKKYGSNDTGTWDGMVGELLRGEADMAIAPLTITADRESVIDFSKPFMSLGISIMIKKMSKKPPSFFSFMNPLSNEVWMCIIFAYIGVSVVLFLVSRFSPFEWHVDDKQDSVANNFTIFNSLWFSLGAFMQQGVDIEPRSMSGRIVGSVWWFFTLILISSYTANLAAFLTSERMQSPIESAEDLAKQTEIKYGTIKGGSTQGFFKKSTIPTYERMWAFMSSTEPWVFVDTTDAGVNLVREKKGKYAFLTESTQNEYTNQRKPCDTMKVGSNLDAKGYGIGTPMGSDLRYRITLSVLELHEKSELANLQTKWWYDKGECGKEGPPKKVFSKKNLQQEATSSLKLSNVAGIFYILMSGLILSLFIAAIEFFHKTRLDAKRKKMSFARAARSVARLSLTGQPQETFSGNETPDTQPGDLPPNMTVSTYSYCPPGQLLNIDGYGDANMQTQV
ncbi:hypothetical protein HELRODRAFT_95450 [Helobdella robusta]|uniref:Glutamate receptor n=1 Tax=Helobdella robusta TaxID=6412 RepID=T1G960_HELRO|nr:hypothetical protein HELRODRAFT_95450 [Helobdella robusta]ESN96468.1 hypothetical protein HELRODRAFT_95450 [Helobdella robusta]